MGFDRTKGVSRFKVGTAVVAQYQAERWERYLVMHHRRGGGEFLWVGVGYEVSPAHPCGLLVCALCCHLTLQRTPAVQNSTIPYGYLLSFDSTLVSSLSRCAHPYRRERKQ